MSVRSKRDTVALRVVQTVAAAKDVPPTTLSPLTESIDADALNAITTPSSGLRELRFEYEGYTVVLDEDGNVALQIE
jgi:hypothetical protein